MVTTLMFLRQARRTGWIVIFFCLVLGLPAATFPLQWRWSSPRPHGNNIIDMIFKDGLLIQIAERGQIYSSTDFDTFTIRNSGTTNALRSITTFNGRIVITGENGTVVWGDSIAELNYKNLGTTDWLESVVSSPSRLVAVGDYGAIYTSTDGVNWQRVSVTFTDWMRSVAYGTPLGGGRFVAVGETGFVATSQNGTTWVTQARPTSEDLNKVAWVGTQFLATASSGRAFFSANGVTWASVTTGASATNDLFVASWNGSAALVAGESELRLSDARWSNELSSTKAYPAPDWTYLSAIWDGASWWAGGRTGMLVQGFRTNSTSDTFWFQWDDSPRSWLWEVVRMPNLFIAVGDNTTIMTSPNGASWNTELIPASVTNVVLLGVGGRANFAVAVGSGGTILVSPDERRQIVSTNSTGGTVTNEVSTLGIVWASVNSGVAVDLQGICTRDGMFVATGGGGTVLTSTDGTNWVRRTTPTTLFLSSVAAHPGGFVAVGDDGALITSPNGIDWTLRNVRTTDWLYRVRYLNGKLIVVGQNGAVLTSSDAETWVRQTSGTTRWLNDIVWLDDMYFVVGTQATVLTSADALTWTERPTITPKSLYGAAHADGRLVIVGIEGVILRSQVVPQTTPISLEFTHSRSAQNVTTNEFIFFGEPDQRFSFDRAGNLGSWSTVRDYDVLDGNQLLYYQEVVTNAVPKEFFRTRLK